MRDGDALTEPHWSARPKVPRVSHEAPAADIDDRCSPPPEIDLREHHARTPIGDLARIEAIAARLVAREPTRYERFVKPVVDRLFAAILIVVFMPVLLFVTLAVLISVGRPVLINQPRTGRHGRVFTMLKFRTMLPDRRVTTTTYDGPDRRRTHKSADDPRHTQVGRLLRKTSLDELPQLFNVLRGDMSMVGPRPEMAALAAGYVSWQQSRHVVKPGVTGLWQTTARGEGRLLHECVDVDLRYIQDLSFRHDIAILARTPIALLRSREVI